MLAKVSFGSLGLVVGGILTAMGFIAYATGNATLNLAGFFYGIPLLLGGLALKISELKPTPFSKPTSPQVLKLREAMATPTQNQIRKDVTRYRYGQDAHLDLSLEKVGLSPNDDERPVLVSLRETETDGLYTLVLEFESPAIPFTTWQEKQSRIENFFGPQIKADISQPEAGYISLAIISSPE